LQVRPTSDRLRETLFNILAPVVEGSRFLDLCAGSGAVGIEALSRGAAHTTFVDRSRKMCALIETNLDLLGVPEQQTEVVLAEALEFIRRAPSKKKGPWDCIYFDPPYESDYQTALETVAARSEALLADQALLIAEHHHKNNLPEEIGVLQKTRYLKQGDSALSFYRVGG
jgi:16S rRNA (guanine(966)-N(2))-methyltransferase RsmD